MAVEEKAKAMKYKVQRDGPGGSEVIKVTAESGDEAALKAFKVGCVIRGITPDDDADEDSLMVEQAEKAVEEREARAVPNAKAQKAAAELEEKSDKAMAERKVPPYV